MSNLLLSSPNYLQYIQLPYKCVVIAWLNTSKQKPNQTKQLDILIVTHTHTHLGGHPADGGYIISCFDEVGGVLLQLKLTQPLVDGLRVLTTERREIYEAALSHTHRNIHLGAHTHSFQLTLPSRSCSGLMKPFWGVPLTCRREPPRKHTQSIVEGDRLHLTLLWGTTGWANQTHQETHGTQTQWVQAKCKTMLKITQGCLDTVIICINVIHVPVNQVMLNQSPPCSCVGRGGGCFCVPSGE